jgi:hypothetical protein
MADVVPRPRLTWSKGRQGKRQIAGQPSAERRRRAEALLDTLLPLGPPTATLRLLRVIEILEQIGGGEARRLSRGWTADAWGEVATNEARAALRRVPE